MIRHIFCFGNLHHCKAWASKAYRSLFISPGWKLDCYDGEETILYLKHWHRGLQETPLLKKGTVVPWGEPYPFISYRASTVIYYDKDFQHQFRIGDELHHFTNSGNHSFVKKVNYGFNPGLHLVEHSKRMDKEVLKKAAKLKRKVKKLPHELKDLISSFKGTKKALC